MSQAVTAARRPSDRTSSATFSETSLPRADSMMSAPSSARANAASRPSPGPTPATTATLPSSSMRSALELRDDAGAESLELIEQLVERAAAETHLHVRAADVGVLLQGRGES